MQHNSRGDTSSLGFRISPRPRLLLLVTPNQHFRIDGKRVASMDVVTLRSRIVATLNPDTDARRQAELDLKAVCVSEGRVSGGDILTSLGGESCWIY